MLSPRAVSPPKARDCGRARAGRAPASRRLPTPRRCAITRGESGSAAARRTRSTPTHLRGAGAAGRRAERGPLTAPRPRVSPLRRAPIRRQAKSPGAEGRVRARRARHRPVPTGSVVPQVHRPPVSVQPDRLFAARRPRLPCTGRRADDPGPQPVPSSRAPPPCTRSVPPARSLTSPRSTLLRPGRPAQSPSPPRGAAVRPAAQSVIGLSPRRRREFGGVVLEDDKAACPSPDPPVGSPLV